MSVKHSSCCALVLLSESVESSCNAITLACNLCFPTDGSVILMMMCTSTFLTWSKSCTRTHLVRRDTLDTGSAVCGGKEE